MSTARKNRNERGKFSGPKARGYAENPEGIPAGHIVIIQALNVIMATVNENTLCPYYKQQIHNYTQRRKVKNNTEM